MCEEIVALHESKNDNDWHMQWLYIVANYDAEVVVEMKHHVLLIYVKKFIDQVFLCPFNWIPHMFMWRVISYISQSIYSCL